MGNVHVFHHRFPALAASAFASLTLALSAIAGTTCSFLDVEANDGRFIEFTSGVEQEAVTRSSFGVLCDSYYFDSEGDTMWGISKIFLYISLALGGIAAALAWTVTWCIPPSIRTWKLLSVVSALTAVLNIPIFLLFESEPCTIDISRQKCVLSFGSFLLMSGTISSIAVVLLTQCMDPPTWGRELDAWKVGKRGEEPTACLARGMVASDEYPESEKKDPANPPDAASTVDDAVQPIATAGILEGFRRWRKRQKWARSSDLKQTGTIPSSQDDEEAVPFAGEGSYYANSNNSRLLLKVTPEGTRPGDDQASMVSFGDLDDYVRMVEEGKVDDTMSIGSLEEYMESEAVPEDATLLILPENESQPKALSTATTDGHETFKDEPQFYSEMKPPPSSNDDKGLLANDDSDTAEELDANRQSKLSRGIRSLTSRVIQNTNRRSKSGRTYTTLDDDDEASGVHSPPMTLWTGNKAEGAETDIGRDSVTEDESSRGVRSPSDRDHLHHQTLLFDWNALHAAANAGILLPQEPHSDSDSSDEDEPAQVSYTSDDSFEPDSSSLGHCPDDEDDNSAFSGSTISDISDRDDDEHDLVIGEGVCPSPRKERRRHSRRSPRRSRRDYSSANSISSYTSVLDMTIDEETDMDLKEFESSDDDIENKIHAGGYKSAPETNANRKLSPYAFIHSGLLPASSERGYIIPKTEHVDVPRSLEDNSLKPHDLVTPDTSSSQVSPVAAADLAGEGSEPAYNSSESSSEGQEPIGYDSSASAGFGSGADTEDDSSSNSRVRRCRSMSIPRRRKNASVHPLVTPPMSPASVEERKNTCIPWREERLFKGGIHSTSSHIISDSETSGELHMPEASAKTSMSRRARKARIRRLQSESITHRQRSRTLDPPKSRRRYDRQSSYHVSESRSATMNRLLFGSEHGPEDASL